MRRTRPPTSRRRGRLVLALPLALGAAACGGETPEELAGFRLGTSQSEVLAATRAAEDRFRCTLRGGLPRETRCEGPTQRGRVELLVRNDTLARIRLWPDGATDRRGVRRLVRSYGAPVWRDRRAPADGGLGYSTLWTPPDSSRALELMCAGAEPTPPCRLELRLAGRTAIRMRRDSLLGSER